MRSFPIQLKPKSVDSSPRLGNVDLSKDIIEIPNLISVDQVDRLIQYARNKEASGLHRRGSKSSFTPASFYTCLVFHYADPIYELLDHIWTEYAKKMDASIEFIEPYEIKIYEEGDKFGKHHDACFDPITRREKNQCKFTTNRRYLI